MVRHCAVWSLAEDQLGFQHKHTPVGFLTASQVQRRQRPQEAIQPHARSLGEVMQLLKKQYFCYLQDSITIINPIFYSGAGLD